MAHLSRAALRKWLLILAVVAAAFVFTSLAHASPNGAPDELTASTVTTIVASRVRSGPGVTYTYLTTLYPDTTVPVMGRNAGQSWLYIEYKPGAQGWISRWLVTPNGEVSSLPVVTPGSAGSVSAPPSAPPASNPPAATNVTATTLSPVNLRPEPGVAKPPITQIPGGMALGVLGRNSAATWINVTYQGQQGWVAAYLVRLSGGTAASLPVVGVQAAPPTSAPPTSAPPAAAPPSAPAVAYNAHLSNVGPHLEAIYQRGQLLGNNPRRFTKVGDCEMEFRWFLQDFDAGVYNLGSYQYLQGVLGQFPGSFAHLGDVANAGMSSSAIFQNYWSDPAVCLPGESPLACEYRTYKPSIALIMLRTIDKNAIANGQFYSEVSQAAQMSIDMGVIPVLETMPYWGPNNPDPDSINNVIRRVAAEKNIPLWDWYVSSEQLPNRGVTADYHIDRPADGNYTTYFTPERMQTAANRRNLEALEVLHAIWTQVIQ